MLNDKGMEADVKVLIHVDGVARADFFMRLAKVLPIEDGCAISFVTESSAAADMLQRSGHQATLLPKRKAAPNDNILALYDHSLCGALGTMNRRAAAGLYHEIHSYLDQERVDVFWCWNGSKFIDRVFRDTGVPVKAFEMANVPGYFVIEDDGVNAESATYHRLVEENAPQPAPDGFDFEAWRAEYIAGKDQQKSIPQAKVPSTELRDKVATFLSVLKTTPRFLAFQMDRILGYLMKPWVQKKLNAIAAKRVKRGRVVFFPQQVSSDTQLIFNSDYDNEAALDLLLEEADETTSVLSNLHPAEHRLTKMLSFLRRCKREPQLVPATGGAWALLKAADEVVTINSTVGLEAAILGRPCRFLGRSVFMRLAKDADALKWFLGAHIVPMAVLDRAAPLDHSLVKRLLPDAPA